MRHEKEIIIKYVQIQPDDTTQMNDISTQLVLMKEDLNRHFHVISISFNSTHLSNKNPKTKNTPFQNQLSEENSIQKYRNI